MLQKPSQPCIGRGASVPLQAAAPVLLPPAAGTRTPAASARCARLLKWILMRFHHPWMSKGCASLGQKT
eukprot:1156607-Pelagomonas_calceolata.AAC.2